MVKSVNYSILVRRIARPPERRQNRCNSRLSGKPGIPGLRSAIRGLRKFPVCAEHRFQQDNDPKHTSKWAKEYFKNKINWWRTPPASPDLNPIENVWGAMKQYLWDYVKPRSIQELKDGIKKFWLTLTPQRCQKYIHHQEATFCQTPDVREF